MLIWGVAASRLAPRLRVVPGVEEVLLLMVLGIVEQPPAGLPDEDPPEQAPPGLARAGQQSGHHRPGRPALEMLEGGPVRLGDQEILVAVRHRP
jgi:hypothetical protein